MDPASATPSASNPAPKTTLLATWPYSVQLAVAMLLALSVGFLLSRALAGDPVRRDMPATVASDTRAGPRLDLNRATAAELALLPGMGPTRAQSIEDYRGQHGDFASLDDLRKVPGIGPKTLERLRGLLFVGPVAETRATRPLDRPAAARPIATPSAKSKKQTTLSAPIDVNHADTATLQKLPGIGPKLSQRIVDERTSRGPFKTIDELRRVPGIGPKTLEKLRPHVIVEQPPPAASS